jgi:hypothetical protein
MIEIDINEGYCKGVSRISILSPFDFDLFTRIFSSGYLSLIDVHQSELTQSGSAKFTLYVISLIDH